MVKVELAEKIAKLDAKDRKILFELDSNSRQSAAEIGRKVRLGKQVVAYRIKKLASEGIIEKFYAIYDTAKLGFTTYKIFIRLQNTNTEKEKEITGFIKNHQNVQFFITCDGNYDMVFNIIAKSVVELNDILSDFESRYGNFIAEREFIIMLFSSFFTRDHLINQKVSDIRKPMYFGSKPEEPKLDETDYKILGLFGINARMPIIDIAKKVNIGADAVSQRIKKMEKAQIIHNYVILPNFSLLGQTSYKVLFSMHNITKEREKSFFEFCRQHPNIWFHSKSLGKWDLEINMDVNNAEMFRKIMMEIKNDFSDIIKEYNTLQVSKVYEFNFYPMGKNKPDYYKFLSSKNNIDL